MARRLHLAILHCAAFALLTATSRAQVFNLAELNTTQIEKLDRAHTVILIPDGIVEEHGPYLPTFTDGFLDEALTQEVARAIVARPGWGVVIFPTIPLGTDPANSIAHRWTFPGSVTIQPETMRAVFFDLADSLGLQGFRHIFLLDSHGGPSNSRALDQASDYFHDTYGGRMVHLLGLMPILESVKAPNQALTPAQLAENGLSVHADAVEQSLILFLRPALAPLSYREAPSLPGATFSQLIAVASAPSWPGYLGAPRYASPALGALAFGQMADALRHLIPQFLDGTLDPSSLPRYGDIATEQAAEVEAPFLAQQQKIAEKHNRWLAAHPLKAPTHP